MMDFNIYSFVYIIEGKFALVVITGFIWTFCHGFDSPIHKPIFKALTKQEMSIDWTTKVVDVWLSVDRLKKLGNYKKIGERNNKYQNIGKSSEK